MEAMSETTKSYADVLRLAENLSQDEIERLIVDLAARASERPDRRSILELAGLGAEIWAGIDAQEYVSRERASWNG